MDLWIRSQDGQDLWKANVITIQDYLKTKAVDIVVSSGMEQIKKFATYKTKEKALKVIDEIQKFINHWGADQVYQMPADDGVDNAN